MIPIAIYMTVPLYKVVNCLYIKRKLSIKNIIRFIWDHMQKFLEKPDDLMTKLTEFGHKTDRISLFLSVS